MTDEQWDRLADAVRSRRVALGMTQADVQRDGGPSTAKLREIENGRTKTLSPSKRRDLERALHWEQGGVDKALAGETPLPREVERGGDVGEADDARTAINWPDLSTEGGRLNEESLRAIIVDYGVAQGKPPIERVELMAAALRRSIHSVRMILLKDEDRSVRANAIDALNPADAALTFLQQDLALVLEEKETPRVDNNPSPTPATPPTQEQGAPGTQDQKTDDLARRRGRDFTKDPMIDQQAAAYVGDEGEVERARREQDEAGEESQDGPPEG